MIAACAIAAVAAAPAAAFESLGTWGQDRLDNPFDLAVNPDTGHQYVADHDHNRIVEFDANGGFVRAWGSFGTADTQFKGPGGVGLDSAGNVWVTDEGNDRIKKFSPSGNLLDAFGTSGTAAGQLSGPDDVAVDAAGNFYEAEQGGRVQKFDAAGSFVTYSTDAPNPTGIAIFGTAVYVVNYNSQTGQRFDTDVNLQGTFGGLGTAGGKFNQPWHLGIDLSGHLYVADRSNNRVQEFGLLGNFLETFGWGVSTGAAQFEICTAGCGAGTFGFGAGQLGNPGGVGVDRSGNVYVLEQSTNRVQKFGEPTPGNPASPSNEFSLGKVKKNKRKGTAALTVVVPGPGQLVLTGKGLKRSGAVAGSAGGAVKLLIKAKGKKRRKLGRTGQVRVGANVTYTPTNGDPNTHSTRIKLLKRLA